MIAVAVGTFAPRTAVAPSWCGVAAGGSSSGSDGTIRHVAMGSAYMVKVHVL